MKKTNTLTLAIPTQHLRQLTIIRSLLLGFLWLSLALSFWVGDIEMPYNKVSSVLLAFSVIHLLTFFRLRKNLIVTEIEFFIQLLIDVICLNTLFFFSGGASNPCISYLLVPICISAATLPWRFTWMITGLCMLAYTALLFFHITLPIFAITHEHEHAGPSWHIIGMWFNFSISAMLITYFVVRMARALRQQDEALNRLREDELRNEQLMAVAVLAAGAAHEMNTPLSTMTVLLSELRDQYKNNPELLPDLQLLTQQVSHCAKTLKQLVQDSSAATHGQFKQQSIKAFCNSIIDRWQLMRPSVNFLLDYADNLSDQTIALDPRLDQAIINLLNNAADASPQHVSIKISSNENILLWSIIDEGSGINKNLHPLLGQTVITTKEYGLGLGMLLSHATIKRYGGSVTQLANHPQGTITNLQFPIKL